MRLYVSVRTESSVAGLWFAPDSAAQARLDHNFIVVSEIPWGDEGDDWSPELIGPIHESHTAEAMAAVVNLLYRLGNDPVTPTTP